MITTICFSICGCFNYPILKNSLFLEFIKKISNIDETIFRIELIKIDRKKISHNLLFNSGEWLSEISTNLSLLESESNIPLSICFKNKYNVTSEILLKSINDRYFELSYRLEEEELDSTDCKERVIQECAFDFFETFRPKYGCCGTEMFIDEIENIEKKYIISSKFYYMGYIDFNFIDEFYSTEFENNKNKFLVKPIRYGNIYINHNTKDGSLS